MGRAPLVFLLCGALLALASGTARAQGLLDGLMIVLDTNASAQRNTVTNTLTGETDTVTFDTLYPRLTVNADTMLYPMLRLSAGGTFESNRLVNASNGPDASTTSQRPFFELRSTSQIFAPGFGYYRREQSSVAGGAPGLKLVSEDYTGYLSWKPEGLPQSDFQLVHTNAFDGDRSFLDASRNLGAVQSRYIYGGLGVYYLGSLLDGTDRRHAVDTRQTTNSGRLDYAQAFMDRRLLFNATYNVAHFSVTTQARGSDGEVAVPVFATTGLSATSDFPVTTKLTTNPLVVDGNLTASAGINLGVPPVGGETRARNIGLDFLNPALVNRLLVWIDRELPTDIARSFTWEIYTSPDNILWRREGTAVTAPFGPFENRFVVDFPGVTARYVKIVTRPLSATVPDASKYPNILVTELQAFVRRSANQVNGTVSSTTQNLASDVRFRLLDAPALFYEGSYWFNDATGPNNDRQLISNGLSVTDRLGRLFGVFGRASLEYGDEPQGRRAALVTNATLTFDPIRTFSASVLYSGLDERLAAAPTTRRGVSVQTSSQVYRGVDLQVGFGWSSIAYDVQQLRDRFFNMSTTVAPRRDLTFSASYNDTSTTRSGVFVGPPSLRARQAFLSLAYDPLRTVHLAVSQEITQGNTASRRTLTFTNVGASWSPFPDGMLQFYFSYNESLRPIEFGTVRDVQQGVRWTINGRSYLDVSYRTTKTEFPTQRIESRSFNVNLRLSL